jgi:hypothetical protein
MNPQDVVMATSLLTGTVHYDKIPHYLCPNGSREHPV